MCKEGWKWISFHGWIQPLYLLLLLGTQCLLASPLWKKTIPSLSCQFCVFMFFAVAARLAVILGLPVCSTRLRWLPYLDFKTQNRNVCWPFSMPLPTHRAVLAWFGSGWSQEYFAVVCCGEVCHGKPAWGCTKECAQAGRWMQTCCQWDWGTTSERMGTILKDMKAKNGCFKACPSAGRCFLFLWYLIFPFFPLSP